MLFRLNLEDLIAIAFGHRSMNIYRLISYTLQKLHILVVETTALGKI